MQRLPRYMEALAAEINLRQISDAATTVRSVYLGGGTPSLLSTEQIDVLLGQLKRRFSLSADCEITLEANPGTFDTAYLERLKTLGISRLSLGVQSFLDTELRLMGRIHNSQDAKDTLHRARNAGFDHIGIDLIYGLPGQSRDAWMRSLDQAVALKPDHISAYTLTWSEHTPLGRRIEQGSLKRPEEDIVAAMYETTVLRLAKAGYQQYEVSNFARPGYESVHNHAYWSGRPYLGLGASAHGFLPPQRYWNIADVQGYIDAIALGRLPEAGQETLSEAQRRMEQIALGLRQTEGLPLEWIVDRGRLADFIDAGWIEIVKGRVMPTSSGLFRADGMAAALA